MSEINKNLEKIFPALTPNPPLAVNIETSAVLAQLVRMKYEWAKFRFADESLLTRVKELEDQGWEVFQFHPSYTTDYTSVYVRKPRQE